MYVFNSILEVFRHYFFNIFFCLLLFIYLLIQHCTSNWVFENFPQIAEYMLIYFVQSLFSQLCNFDCSVFIYSSPSISPILLRLSSEFTTKECIFKSKIYSFLSLIIHMSLLKLSAFSFTMSTFAFTSLSRVKLSILKYLS